MNKFNQFKTLDIDPHQSNWVSVYPGYKFKDKYLVEKKIVADGAQAQLYLCTYQSVYYIVKLYRSGVKFDDEILDKIRKIKSDCIVQIIDDGMICNQRFEVIPYYKNGDLEKYGRISYENIKNVIIPFLNRALDEIHKIGIVHMDIKPSNIFVDADGALYLGDFGIASILDDTSINFTGAKGTLGYRPPESYTEINIKSTQFDSYGFGITIIHLWLGYSPYKNQSEMQIIKKTLDGQIFIPADMPNDFKNLIKGLTAYDKKARWNDEMVYNWILGVDIGDRIPNYKFMFLNFKIASIKDFVYSISQSDKHWNEAVYRFKAGLFEEYFKSKNDDIYSIYEYSTQIEDYNRALCYLMVKVQLIYYNNYQIVYIPWKNNLFCGFDKLADEILNGNNAMTNVIADMKLNGILADLFIMNMQINNISPFIDLDEFENIYNWGMYMSNNPFFYYNDIKIFDFSTLLNVVMKDEENICQTICELMDSKLVRIWFLEKLGITYEQVLDRGM